jgi:hypothetical protein
LQSGEESGKPRTANGRSADKLPAERERRATSSGNRGTHWKDSKRRCPGLSSCRRRRPAMSITESEKALQEARRLASRTTIDPNLCGASLFDVLSESKASQGTLFVNLQPPTIRALGAKLPQSIGSCEEQGMQAKAHVSITGSTPHGQRFSKDAVLLRQSEDAWRIVLPSKFGQ